MALAPWRAGPVCPGPPIQARTPGLHPHRHPPDRRRLGLRLL